MSAPIITLTSDWGTADFYVGALKGRLLSLAPESVLIDISHQIEKSNQLQGAFVLRNTWKRFPKGTVHVLMVISGGNQDANLLVIKFDGHFFLGPDDGVFSLLFENSIADTYYVMDDKGEKVPVNSDMIAASAAYLSRGGEVANMGSRVEQARALNMWKPSTDDYSIRGSVIYVDGYGNLVTNITPDMINENAKGRTFEIIMRNSKYTVNSISTGYNTVVEGDMVAVINESGFIELAIRNGSAEQLLGLHFGDMVRVDFK
ncbi:MAG: S-adenosyl-l-methionine hydroxide adenosyltransferase family protein [Bacteroidota bacterium]